LGKGTDAGLIRQDWAKELDLQEFAIEKQG
jgi:hypothetical protein